MLYQRPVVAPTARSARAAARRRPAARDPRRPAVTRAGCRARAPTPTATSPAELWPNLTPASSPAWDYDDGEAETVKGVTAPGDDIRKVDPVAVVTRGDRPAPGRLRRLEGAVPRDGPPDRPTAARSGRTARCPVLKPYYRDLTGDGRDDLTLGFRLLPGNQTAVRVYTVEGGRLVQVMANDDAVSGVELAGRSVIIRSPSDLAGLRVPLPVDLGPGPAGRCCSPTTRCCALGRRERLSTPSASPSFSPSASASHSPAASPSASPSATP